jgi:hypothetical protein
MRSTVMVALNIVRLAGILQIALGVLFWLGIARSLVTLHIISGLILVLALWVLAFLAIQRGANSRLGIAAVVWGLIVVALGMTQATLIPGPAHWVIQVLHLLVGMAAIGQAHSLATSILGERPRAVSGV